MTTSVGAAGPTVVEIAVERPAHGGHCVGRVDGRVVFVRHCVPGEKVLAALTQAGPQDAFWRAETVEVLESSPDRVASVWPAAGFGGVGGGELAHVSLAGQRRWKTEVLVEQLHRLGGVSEEQTAGVVVAGVPGDDERGGLGYRTRVEFATTVRGELGMHKHRSREVVPVGEMPLAAPGLAELGVFGWQWPRKAQVKIVLPVGGDRELILVNGQPWRRSGADTRPCARRTVREVVRARVGGRDSLWEFKVAASGFWQVHDAAPGLLAQRVVELLGDAVGRGATVLDLYSGAGLLTAPLADVVTGSGVVVAVEQDRTAVRDARRGVAQQEHVQPVVGDVAEVLAAGVEVPDRVDAVVLDPPRAGAGREVLAAVCARAPKRVVYVACDPASLARDVAYLAGLDYRLVHVEGHDVFPHTHHFESLAVFER